MRLIILIVLFWTGIFVALPTNVAAQCSGERWTVKVGRDADAPLVNLLSVTPTTITELTSRPVPSTLPEINRIQPVEITTWSISATLIKYVRSYDGDYHMIFTDASGRTMIGEIPDPACISSSSRFYQGVRDSRAKFDALFTATNTFKTTNVPVQVTGVGFFDYNEGQDGYALNGIELHPIINIEFGAAFSLSSSPSAISIDQNSSGNVAVSSSYTNNFSSPITLSASGLPTGSTASFSPNMIVPPGSTATLTISVDGSTPLGTYGVVVTALGGGQSRSTTVNVTVNNGSQQLLGNPGFENGSTNSAPWTPTAGVIDNSTYEASHSGSWKAWLNGFGKTHTDTVYQQVAIPASAASATLSFWMHIDTVETSANKANDTFKFQIRNTSGTVLATLATYSNLNAAAGFSQKSFDLTSYKGQTIQLYMIGVENSSLKTSFVVDDLALNVVSTSVSPDFTIAASPTSLTASTGSAAASTVTTTVKGGFNAAIALSATGLPTGTTANFSPASIAAPGSGSATLTFAVGSSTAAGTYNIVVNAAGAAQSHSVPLTLTVTSGGGSTTQKLGNPGFENGSTTPSPWIVTQGVVSSSSVEPAHGGLWKAWLSGYGSAHTDSIYQQVILPSTTTNAVLTFWRHIDTAETTSTTAYDTFKVQVRNSSGSVLATLATYSNLNAAPGFSEVTFDLTSFKGQTIQIYIVGVEDASLQTSFVVDDFSLAVTAQ